MNAKEYRKQRDEARDQMVALEAEVFRLEHLVASLQSGIPNLCSCAPGSLNGCEIHVEIPDNG